MPFYLKNNLKMSKSPSFIERIAEKTAFVISPNPLGDGQPLQISLENDFFGTVKLEILGLDGRVLKTIFREKTAQNLDDIGKGAFLVRVLDGKTSEARLVLKF